MSSPSELLKVNYLVMKHLHFGSVRGDLQEGHCYLSRCYFPLFLVQIPVSPSTKSVFLCAFCLRDPRFRAFRAQNRGFCALLAFGTPVLSAFEHKIEVFVLFWPSGPPFSGVSSTKSGFLCAFGLRDPRFRAFRAQNRHFRARADGETATKRCLVEMLRSAAWWRCGGALSSGDAASAAWWRCGGALPCGDAAKRCLPC